eukprot:g7856.t1
MKLFAFLVLLVSAAYCSGRVLTQDGGASARASVRIDSPTNGAITVEDSMTTPTGMATASATVSVQNSPSPKKSPSPSPGPSVEPSPSPKKSPSPSPGPSVEPSLSPKKSPSPSSGPSVEPTPESTASPSTSGAVDIYLLADTTDGMQDALKALQTDQEGFVADLYDVAANVRVGVGAYKDVGDSFTFQYTLPLQKDEQNAASAILSWEASGGGDDKKETQLYALERVATEDRIGFRADAIKVLVWIGDQPGRDPVIDSTEASATSTLKDAGIIVIAIDVLRLDASKQASRITAATNGLYRKFDLNASNKRTASVSVSDEDDDESTTATATASGTGDNVDVSARAGDKTATATNSDSPSIYEVILEAIEEVIS